MAGIYIHIPFCRQACHYCDFHFSTNLSSQQEMVDSIALEIDHRQDYLTQKVHTIYFGGGTPSLLSTQQLEHLLNTVKNTFEVDGSAEVTLEANPEDLSPKKASELFSLGINRLSIGIQTFDDNRLKWMNRAHDADAASQAFENARTAGFQNISLDLIYAIPDHSRSQWESDIQEIVKLNPEHISLYGLTIEDRTVFGKWEQENKLIQVPEDDAAKQYLFAIDYLTSHGYQQYEVSNFGKANYYSRHNNSYWMGIPYLGVGPGAHSFDGDSRRFNIRNNPKYLKSKKANDPYFETELLSQNQRINEQILTQLRTARGLSLIDLNNKLSTPLEEAHSEFLEELIEQDLVAVQDGFLRLKPSGFLVADSIALRLFLSD